MMRYFLRSFIFVALASVCCADDCIKNKIEDSDSCSKKCNQNICKLWNPTYKTIQKLAPTSIFQTQVNGKSVISCRCCCALYRSDCYTTDPSQRKGTVSYSYSCLSKTGGGGGGSGGDDQPKNCENSNACVHCQCNGKDLPEAGVDSCGNRQQASCKALYPAQCGSKVNQEKCNDKPGKSDDKGISFTTLAFFIVLLAVVGTAGYFVVTRFRTTPSGSGADSNYRPLG
jgi:hypothetical protein